MKKILLSIPWFSPAFKAGGPAQSVLNLVRKYNDHYSFNVVTADTDNDGTTLKIEASNQWLNLDNHISVFYCSAKSGISRLYSIFNSNRADVLFLTGIYSFSYTILPVIVNSSPRKIISVRGMLHPPALKQKAFKKKIFITF